MKKIIGYDSDGNKTLYNSVTEAANAIGCNESTIRRALDKPTHSAKGMKWVTRGNDSVPLKKLPREIDEELGVSPESVSTVWAKQMRNGSYRYSIKFNEKEKEIDAEKLINSFKECLEHSRITPQRIPYIKGNNKALMVYTSDKHIGAKTNRNSMYDNHYDADEFERRMVLLLHKIKYLSEDMGNFNDIFIIDLGDPLDGFKKQTTRGGHSLPQNMTNEEAFDVFVKVHTYFFDELVKMGITSKIHFKAVTNDNHAGSFGYTAQRALQIYLNARYPDIETQITDQFMGHFHVGKHTFIITHGKDKEDRMRPMPLNLNDQTKNFITDYIDYHRLARPAGFVHIVKGDMHQVASQLTSRFRYRNVLSLYGASAWIHNNFGSQTIAGVAIDVIDKDCNTILETNLIFNQ